MSNYVVKIHIEISNFIDFSMKLKTVIDIYFVYFVNLVKWEMLKTYCVRIPLLFGFAVLTLSRQKEKQCKIKPFLFCYKNQK